MCYHKCVGIESDTFMINYWESKMNDNDTNGNVVVVEKRKVGRPAGNPNTKLARCKEIYSSMISEGCGRPEILAAFTKIGCSEKSAEVYFYKVKTAISAS